MARKYQKKIRGIVKSKCIICGNEFVKNTYHQKLCSPACRLKRHYQNVDKKADKNIVIPSGTYKISDIAAMLGSLGGIATANKKRKKNETHK